MEVKKRVHQKLANDKINTTPQVSLTDRSET
jgi:hypothetical protein